MVEQTFAQFLRAKREKRELTQREAAEQTGVSRQTWVSWERGAKPNVEHLQVLSKWCRTSMKRLAEMLP